MSAPAIAVRPAGGKGRGVFATAPIAAGTVVESAPTIEMSAADATTVVGTRIDDYYFAHPEDPDAGLLVLGLASLCNHAETANVDTAYRRVDGLGWLVELVANRDIAAGEEVTRRYACAPWFPVDA